MISPVAFIVLAHNDAPKVRRLLGALGAADVFLHCDRRTTGAIANAMLPRSGGNIVAVPRVQAKPFTWSLVEVELSGLRLALARSQAEHIVVMSGACYPLVSLEELSVEMEGWRGRSRFELNPLPYKPWNTRWHRDGGSWRFCRRFAMRHGRLLTVGRVPFIVGRRQVPRELLLHASAHWKIYSRIHAKALLQALDANPEQVRFWRGAYAPEEACAASLLRSPAFVGDLSDTVVDDLPWFIRWPTQPPKAHPVWLGPEDFDRLAVARSAAPRDPLRTIATTERSGFRKLFARKVGSAATGLLDRIDEELRGKECEVA